MSDGYDRAITVFSPDGHLLQVEYAQEAVRKGCTAIGVVGKDCIVLGVEKKSVVTLQEERTVRKISSLDSHIVVAFAGLTADARVIINRAQLECQSQRLILGEVVTTEYITRFIASIKQKYTQSNGRRPFGISCLIAGFDNDGTPHLFQTEPSGIYYGWKANTTGRNSNLVKAFFEENYNDEAVSTEEGTIKLAVRALLEVVQFGQKSIELAVLKHNENMKLLDSESLTGIVEVIEAEKKIWKKETDEEKAEQ